VVLRADLEDIPGGPFDRVLANPPYFSNGRIATAFVRTAASVLTPDGVFTLVAKAKDFHRTILEAWFDDVDVSDVQDYGVFEARKPRAGVESESSVESDAAD
jgi:16S rRNA (guanine1207-N2)-methyltransferase